MEGMDCRKGFRGVAFDLQVFVEMLLVTHPKEFGKEILPQNLKKVMKWITRFLIDQKNGTKH